MHGKNRRWLGSLLVGLAFMIWGCGRLGEAPAAAGKIRVVATTGIVADLVANVGGDYVQVSALMGSGVDPHLYKAAQGDIARLSGAEIIFYNGLHLEGKMGKLLERIGQKKLSVAVAEAAPRALLRQPPEFEGYDDPHIWFDASLWAYAVEQVRKALVAYDPDHGQIYTRNAEAYTERLAQLHATTHAAIESIPAGGRLLVTAHDAFGYFGAAYGIEVMGLQGVSTTAEFGLGDVQHLVDVLVERQVKAVFVESSVPVRYLEAVVAGAKARGHRVEVGGQLYSDALGSPGTPAGTYIGMFQHNVDTIVQALR